MYKMYRYIKQAHKGLASTVSTPNNIGVASKFNYTSLNKMNFQSNCMKPKQNKFFLNFFFFPKRSFSATTAQTETVTVENDEDIIKIMKSTDPKKIKNIAIIAHVDHGKTSLVDCMLQQSGALNSALNSLSMDSNELERERGITILSKCTGISYKGYKINIVDTPGHQDFGGEVERIMDMVDSVCLVVCATEGPMPQTRFVLKKALQRGLRPIVIVNKADRDSNRLGEVENEIFDLFCNLNANDDQLEYSLIYASAKNGWAVRNIEDEKKDITVLLDTIIEKTPSPAVNLDAPFSMLVSQTESNPFFGKMLLGRIHSGKVAVGDKIQAFDQAGKVIEIAKIFKMIRRFGMNQIELNEAVAGDIVSISGFSEASVTSTLNSIGHNQIIPSIPIDPPMVSLTIKPNDSPLYSKEGDKFAFLLLKERIMREAENDVSMRVELDPKQKDSIFVFGRGDLHLGILVEKMRREGYEMSLTPPQVIFKEEKGVKLEPIEEVTVEIGLDMMNILMEMIQSRKGIMIHNEELPADKIKVIFEAPSRGLFGLRPTLIALTKGSVIIQSKLKGYDKYRGPLKRNNRGAIICIGKGKTTIFALKDVENHGLLYTPPGTEVYEGMVIGELNKEGEVEVNPCKEKPVSNVRAAHKEEYFKLSPVKPLVIEEAMVNLRADELLEVTPKNLRIRKKILDGGMRRKFKRENRKEEDVFDF